MGNRLSKIATRTGDDGTTGLGDGSRTDKLDCAVSLKLGVISSVTKSSSSTNI
jgi:cob(I)alamin adenosyltransferase